MKILPGISKDFVLLTNDGEFFSEFDYGDVDAKCAFAQESEYVRILGITGENKEVNYKLTGQLAQILTKSFAYIYLDVEPETFFYPYELETITKEEYLNAI